MENFIFENIWSLNPPYVGNFIIGGLGVEYVLFGLFQTWQLLNL